jgi:hypothetical protein
MRSIASRRKILPFSSSWRSTSAQSSGQFLHEAAKASGNSSSAEISPSSRSPASGGATASLQARHMASQSKLSTQSFTQAPAAATDNQLAPGDTIGVTINVALGSAPGNWEHPLHLLAECAPPGW